MMREWSDGMTSKEMSDFWQHRVEEEVARRVSRLHKELKESMAQTEKVPVGFYEAMRNFLLLRERLFPDFPADPAWKILTALAETPEGSDKASLTGIAYGAGVPLATALRYIAAMEDQGIIERIPHPTDKRQVMIHLTDHGRQRLDMIAEKWAMRLPWWLLLPISMLLYGVSGMTL